VNKNVRLLYGFSFFDPFMIVIPVWVPYLATQGITMRQFMELQAVFAIVIAALWLQEPFTRGRLLAVLAAAASFATIGVSGLAALAPLAIVLRPFGLSYEIAVPLMLIVDPLAEIVRTMLNVGVNCMIPALAASPPAIRAELATALPIND